jgi:general secretion pathway protein F
LDVVLNRLADYSEASYASRQKIKLAMVYPIILLSMAILIVSGLMAFVVPGVVEVFQGQGQQLPLLTRGLITLSNFVVAYGWLLLLLLLLLFFAGRYLLQQRVVALWVDHKLLELPLVARIAKGNDSARYASTLAILTGSGVPLVDAMGIASEVVANHYLRQAVDHATQQVREGGSLHRALEDVGHFPPMMVHMVASGEMSGELASMLARVAEHQQKELDNLIAVVMGIFEPAMLLFMGATVLLIVVAILQPIFDINALI